MLKKMQTLYRVTLQIPMWTSLSEGTFYKRWLELFEISVRQKVEEPLVHLHCLFKRR